MKFHLLSNRMKEGYTTFGAVWGKGELKSLPDCRVKNSDGSVLPVQSRITAYYPDGSLKWTAHTADAARLTEEIELITEPEPKQQEMFLPQIKVTSVKGNYFVTFGNSSITLLQQGSSLFSDYMVNRRPAAAAAIPVLKLERREAAKGITTSQVIDYQGVIRKVTLEETGPYRLTAKYEGIHCNEETGEERFPFVIRLQLGAGDSSLKIMHTFLYDGEEEKDFLKGIGLCFEVLMAGEMYNRHIKIPGDYGCFHESCAHLVSWIPKLPEELHQAQMDGERLQPAGEDLDRVTQVLADMPFWDSYYLNQEFHEHFSITKKLDEDRVCRIDCLEGNHSKGVMSIGGENGSFTVGIRDFDKKTPAGLTVEGMTKDRAFLTGWFYSPDEQAYDFRHYAVRGYNKVCYEGYDYKGDSAYGIAVTSELLFSAGEQMIPADEALERFAGKINQPPVYVGTPQEYHSKEALGPWSTECRESEVEVWLEAQLDQAFEFYQNEVSQRKWYGLFNYGDFMHTYDKTRHIWRYDMGGYAWDNTELVPTLWLWLMFLRSGREEVFTLAEKLSRHTSEVDVYHFGRYQGMGSRHNVRHWGCPCKEARIAMAGHHRYYYYLTGDFRLEDIFEELKDNEEAFLRKDPLGDFYDKEEMIYPSHARTGPDWSSLCSNWMTRWERFQDEEYLNKIKIGMNDIKQAPLQLISGPAFEFDPASKHLRYIGERTYGGTHLQICMGAPSIWMEMGDLMEDEEWKRMLADYGRFYYLSDQERQAESGGLIGDREFSFPFFASAMGAYGAWYLKDQELAKTTWQILLGALMEEENQDGFAVSVVDQAGNCRHLQEIPWVTTNFTAQWCLNVIISLHFIREALPKTLGEARSLIKKAPAGGFRKA